MFVAIVHNEGKAPSTVIDCQGQPSHIVVEAYQRTLKDRGFSTGVTHQTVDGDVIAAMVAVAKLERK